MHSLFKNRLEIILLSTMLMTFLFSGASWSQDDTSPADQTQVQQVVKPTVLDTLDLKDMDINDVLKLLAQKSGLNIIAGKSITGRVTIFLQNVEVHDALTIILKANDLAYLESNGVIQIMTGAEYNQVTGHPFGVSTESTIVSLQSAKASDVVAILNQVKSQNGKVIADDESNSVIIQDVPEKMEQLLNYIKTMDVPTQMQVYKLQYVVGEPLVAKLQEMVSPKIGYVRFDSLSNKLFIKDTPLKLQEIMKYITQIDIPRETKVFNINYAKADDLAKTIGPMLTKDVGSIEYDTRSNTLVVTDIAPKINEIKAMIQALDKVDKEVFIEAKIVQITLNDEYQMGVDWDKVINNIGNSSLRLQSNFSIPNAPGSFGEAAIGTMNSGTLNNIVQALDTFGKTRDLSSPRLAVLNNQEASILVGSSQPYATSSNVTNSVNVTTSESVTFIDVGIKLHVTPTIHDDGYITMKIKPEVSSVTGEYNAGSGNGNIPIVGTDEVQTTVRVKDGVTIIIGGLMEDNRSNTKNKVPILGDLPIIGKAFSNEDRNLQKQEIVIFLTPHIINGDVYSDADEYLATTPSLKSEKTYFDPLPKDQSTVPVN